VGAGGFMVQTEVGATNRAHYENKVDLPDAWVKGFLQVQSALAMRPFTFDVRPVDLMTVIRYFMDNNARKPPRGLRFEFKAKDQVTPIIAVLEPWNEKFALAGTVYEGYDRVVRLWGRKRLELLMGVLPYAERVTVGLLGRGLPHFYICHCGPYTFTLVLSGWVRKDWSETSALDLLAPQADLTAEQIAAVYNFVNGRLKATRGEVEAHTLLTAAQAEAALFALCRQGRAIYDPVTRRYRSRELFGEPLNFETILAPDPRIERAKQISSGAAGKVAVYSVGQSETRRGENKVMASVETGSKHYSVLVAVDKEGRVRYAQCECDFFRDNILSRGPCEHILAARFAADEALSALEAQPSQPQPAEVVED
jgi:predicted nucleic acid-binding Zn finger protein